MKKWILFSAVLLFALFLNQNTETWNNPTSNTKQKSTPIISVQDAYKLCTKKSCPSWEVEIKWFLTVTSWVDFWASISRVDRVIWGDWKWLIQKVETIALVPKKSMNAAEKYNFINRNWVFLWNWYLPIIIKWKLKYWEVFTIWMKPQLSLEFDSNNIKFWSTGWCLENWYPYPDWKDMCFKKIDYSISPSNAYNALIKSEIYKKAIKESWSRDIIDVSYDNKNQLWIYKISQQNTPNPGAFQDLFKVSKNKVYYIRQFQFPQRSWSPLMKLEKDQFTKEETISVKK